VQFEGDGFAVEGNAAVPVARSGPQTSGAAPAATASMTCEENACTAVLAEYDAPVGL